MQNQRLRRVAAAGVPDSGFAAPLPHPRPRACRPAIASAADPCWPACVRARGARLHACCSPPWALFVNAAV
eukprot:6401902-Alexandrium_andersonii.AAC.1